MPSIDTFLPQSPPLGSFSCRHYGGTWTRIRPVGDLVTGHRTGVNRSTVHSCRLICFFSREPHSVTKHFFSVCAAGAAWQGPELTMRDNGMVALQTSEGTAKSIPINVHFKSLLKILPDVLLRGFRNREQPRQQLRSKQTTSRNDRLRRSFPTSPSSGQRPVNQRCKTLPKHKAQRYIRPIGNLYLWLIQAVRFKMLSPISLLPAAQLP
jgi:hypothetical protein